MMYSQPWFTKEPNKRERGEEIKWYEFKKYNGLEKINKLENSSSLDWNWK